MADPLSAVASAVTVIAAAASLCETAHSLISGVRSIPHQIRRLGYELQSTATVLHTLNHILSAERGNTHHGKHVCKQKMVNHIYELVVHTKRAVEDSAALLEPFTIRCGDGSRLATLKAFMWEVTKKEEVSALSRTLGSYKSTLSLACSSLAIFNDSRTHDMVHSLQLDVSSFLDALRHESNAKTAPSGSPEEHQSTDIMRAATKYKPPLRRFLERTNSVISRSSGGHDLGSTCANDRSRTDSLMSIDQRLSQRCLDIQTISDWCDYSQQESSSQSIRRTDAHAMPAVSELDSSSPLAELEGDSHSYETQRTHHPCTELPAYSAPIELEACSPACCDAHFNAQSDTEQPCPHETIDTTAESRPSSVYSFETDRDDVLDLAENRDCDESFLSYLSRMSPDAWAGYPNDQVLTLRRQLSSRYHSSNNTASSSADKPERPKIRVNIPDTQRRRTDAITELRIGEDGILEETLDTSASARSASPNDRELHSVLPTLQFGELSLSPLQPDDVDDECPATDDSPNTLPELDFGPDFSPNDAASPWSPTSPLNCTARLPTHAVDADGKRSGLNILRSASGSRFVNVDDEAFTKWDALSPLAVERLL